MPDSNWSTSELNGFHSAAQSLKLYRRADLQDEDTGSSLIEELYVDPLPSNHILQTTLKPNTTFLIGRKGTGKSTVFQRAQHELRKNSSCLSVYVDIKTVFESSQVDPYLLAKADALSSSTVSANTIHQLLLYKTFLSAVITDIQEELKKRVKSSLWQKVKQTFLGSFDDLFVDLNELLDEANDERFISVLGVKAVEIHTNTSTEEQSEFGSSASFGLAKPDAQLSVTAKDSVKQASGNQQTYSDILMMVFNIKELLLRLKDLLSKTGNTSRCMATARFTIETRRIQATLANLPVGERCIVASRGPMGNVTFDWYRFVRETVKEITRVYRAVPSSASSSNRDACSQRRYT